MIRNHGYRSGGMGKVKLHCPACGWQTHRIYRDDIGFGVCCCGTPLTRAPRIVEARRIAKAKAQLEGRR